MSAQQATPIEDAELDALMAELEAQTAGAVIVPKVVAPAAIAPEPVIADDDLAALESLDDVPPPAAVKIVPAPTPTPAPTVSAEDAEMAALEAELAAADTAPVPAAAPAPAPAPAPAIKAVTKPAAKPTPVPEPVNEPEPETIAEPASTPTPAASNRVPFKLNHFIDMGKFRDDTAVSDINLDTCMMQQASLRAYHGAELAGAEQQHALLKFKSDMVEAKLFKQYREKLLAEGEKPTERLIDSYIKDDVNYQQAISRSIAAQQLVSLHKAAIDSLKDRRDMIIQLGADRREEGKGQVRTMVQEAAHEDAKERAMRVMRAAA